MFLNDSEILQGVADRMNTTPAGLTQPKWNNLVAAAHSSAYQKIMGKLLGRGFTVEQINQWDDGANVERDLSLYFCFVNGAVLNNFDPQYIQRISRATSIGGEAGSELDKVTTLQIAGKWIAPGNTANSPGMVSSGRFDGSADLFGVLDPDDTRRGQPMRF